MAMLCSPARLPCQCQTRSVSPSGRKAGNPPRPSSHPFPTARQLSETLVEPKSSSDCTECMKPAVPGRLASEHAGCYALTEMSAWLQTPRPQQEATTPVAEHPDLFCPQQQTPAVEEQPAFVLPRPLSTALRTCTHPSCRP